MSRSTSSHSSIPSEVRTASEVRAVTDLQSPSCSTIPTAAQREPLLDFWRAGSILAVVIGHYLVAGVARDGSELRGINMLAITPRLQVVTWLFQVMPLFFVVGGASNLVSLERAVLERRSMDWVGSRISKLMVPVGVFLGLLSALIMIARLVGVAPSVIEAAVRAGTIQFWFLAVYLLITLCSPVLVRFYQRFGRRSLVAVGSVVAAVDLVSIGSDRLAPLGWANAAAVWIFCTLAGFELRVHLIRRSSGTEVHRQGDASAGKANGRLLHGRLLHGWLLLGAGLGFGVLLVKFGGYPVSLIGVPGQSRSNTSPPSLMLLCACSWQVGFLLLTRNAVESLCLRPRVSRVLSLLNLQAMSIYCWHMVGLIVAAFAADALGYSAELHPRSSTALTLGSSTWWLMKPIWVALAVLVTAGAVLLITPVQMRVGVRALSMKRGTTTVITAALVLASAAARVTTGHLVGTGWFPIDPTTAILLLGGCALLWLPTE